MRLAQPPGIRSTHEGGEWKIARNAGGVGRLIADLETLLKPLAPAEQADLREAIHRKMTRATKGTLTYGPNPADVFRIFSTRLVLEIRIIDHHVLDPEDEDAEPEKRHTRIYFTEPAAVPEQLLFLSLKSKCPGVIGLDEQDAHAARAEALAYEHDCRPSTN